jgi:hypothetical protein
MEDGALIQDSELTFVQCGRKFTPVDIRKICSVVTDLGRLCRSSIIEAVCEELEWFTATGAYKIDACRKLLAKLEAQGILKLPEKRKLGGKPRRCARTANPEKHLTTGIEVAGKLGDIGPVSLQLVKGASEKAACNELIARYHYLGYRKPIGCFLRYFISAPQRGILGCALFAGAARALTIRDTWIGWTAQQRLSNLGWVINNVRFLILPTVRVAHLASHVLGQLERRVAEDWEGCWGYRPVLMESFVDPGRYRGTCYKASNWQYLGQTTGEGLARQGRRYQTTPKMLFVRPLVADFRSQLCSDHLCGRVL